MTDKQRLIAAMVLFVVLLVVIGLLDQHLAVKRGIRTTEGFLRYNYNNESEGKSENG